MKRLDFTYGQPYVFVEVATPCSIYHLDDILVLWFMRASEQGRQEEVGAAGRRRSKLGGEGGNLLGVARLVPAGITSRH